jgi:hypothetical protein
MIGAGRAGLGEYAVPVGLHSPCLPTWIWMQAAIVVFVPIGMIIAITKLA